MNPDGGSYSSNGSWKATEGYTNSLASNVLSGAARTISEVATQSAIEGTSFGKNLMNSLPSIIGAIGAEVMANKLLRGKTLFGDKDHDGILGVLQDISASPVTLGRPVGEKIADLVESGIDLVESGINDVGSLITHGATVGAMERADDSGGLAAAVSGSSRNKLANLTASSGPEKLTQTMIKNLRKSGVKFEIGEHNEVYVWQIRKKGERTKVMLKGDTVDQPGAVKVLQDYNRLSVAINYLGAVDEAKFVIDMVLKKGVPIVTFDDQNGYFASGMNLIYWNPVGALITTDKRGPRTQVSSNRNLQSPSMVLLHEFDHAYQFNYNQSVYKADRVAKMKGYDNKEEFRVISGLELRVARLLGEPTRTNHDAHIRKNGFIFVTVKDPTRHVMGYAGASTD